MNIKLLVATAVFSPFILIIRLVKPIFLLRVGRVRTDRIGHLAGNMDRHINIINNNIDSEAIDFYYVYGHISNRYLLKMWSQEVKIAQGFFSYFLYAIDIVNSFIPGGGSHAIPELQDDQDNLNYYHCSAPNLKFNKREKEKGENYLKSVGLSKTDRFVCFCVRDEAFLKEIFPNNDFSYHDYRNANIETHVEALEKFIGGGNGIYKKAIRMGSVVESKLTSKKIIDYSSSENRNEFLDLFLSYKCDIFLNSGSGLDAVPRLFRTSLVSANVAPMGYIGANPIVFTPKKYWHIKDKRFLTFKEVIQSDIGYYLHSSDYVNNGIRLVENTSDDIYHALLEADDRINGSWNPGEEDLYMQEKFQSLFLPDPRFPSTRAPISSHFLRNNIDLLVD